MVFSILDMKMKNDFISSSNIKMKTGYSDILVEVDKKIINIEMNRNLSEKLIRKNKWYVNTLSSVSAEKNSKLDKLIIQINRSTKARIPKTKELLYEMVRMDKNDPHSLRIPAVNTSRCIGCGACENLCPARPFSAIYVEGHEVHSVV